MLVVNRVNKVTIAKKWGKLGFPGRSFDQMVYVILAPEIGGHCDRKTMAY